MWEVTILDFDKTRTVNHTLKEYRRPASAKMHNYWALEVNLDSCGGVAFIGEKKKSSHTIFPFAERNMKFQEKISMSDIARLAETSTSTVSRVMNGGYVAEATRARILRVMEEASYSPKYLPNRLPRVCVLLRSGFATPYAARILPGLSELLSRDRLQMLVVSESGGDESWTEQSIRDLRPDVLICLGRLSADYLKLEPELKGLIQVSDWEEQEPSSKVAYFAEDMEAYGRMAVEHLHHCGHRRVLLIHRGFTGAGSRNLFKGFSSESRRLGVSTEDVVIPPGFGVEEEWLLRKVPEMLKTERRDITACVLSRSSFNLPFYLGLNRTGLSIPGDVSIVTRDDPRQNVCFDPVPTTFAHDHREVDRHIREAVLRFLDPAGEPVSSVKVRPVLKTGASVAPPASHRS